MKEFKLKVIRKNIHSKSIIGELWCNEYYLCRTLELPWKFNIKSISCIPIGTYGASLRYDKNDKWRLQLTGVKGRSGVQIHIGNYPSEIQGCILVGMDASSNKISRSKEAYTVLKNKFYETASLDEKMKTCKEPNFTPNQLISIEFSGVTGMHGFDLDMITKQINIA